MAYTFKDDGSNLTYYREYNKEVNAKNETLVGNWVEERALRDQIQTVGAPRSVGSCVALHLFM